MRLSDAPQVHSDSLIMKTCYVTFDLTMIKQNWNSLIALGVSTLQIGWA